MVHYFYLKSLLFDLHSFISSIDKINILLFKGCGNYANGLLTKTYPSIIILDIVAIPDCASRVVIS